MIGKVTFNPGPASPNASDRQQLNPYSIIAFFGFETDTAKAFYERCLAWFNECNVMPDCGAVGRQGFHHKVGRFAIIPFQSVKYHLRAHGFEGVERLRLFALKSGGTDILRDSVLSVGWNGGNGIQGFNGQLGAYREAWLETSQAIADLKSDSMMRLARDLASILSPAYGMGFRRDIEKGPTHYALGIPYGVQSYGRCGAMTFAEEKRITAWNHACSNGSGEPFRLGVIREVCPVNFLNDSHLRRQIRNRTFDGTKFNYAESCTLDEWVRQEPGRGEITRLGDSNGRHVWMWTIPEQSIPAIRAALEGSGLVFDYRRYRS